MIHHLCYLLLLFTVILLAFLLLLTHSDGIESSAEKRGRTEKSISAAWRRRRRFVCSGWVSVPSQFITQTVERQDCTTSSKATSEQTPIMPPPQSCTVRNRSFSIHVGRIWCITRPWKIRKRREVSKPGRAGSRPLPRTQCLQPGMKEEHDSTSLEHVAQCRLRSASAWQEVDIRATFPW